MRKLLLLTPFLLINLVQAQSKTSVCSQVIQSAVSPAGECKEYSTPCDVPADWKKVSSCEIVQDRNFGQNLEKRMKKRFASRQKWRTKKRTNTRKATQPRRGFGQSAGSGYKRTRTTRTDSDKSRIGVRKMRTRRNYTKAARDFAKSLNPNRGGYQRPGDATRKERKERRTYKRKIRSSVTKNLRKKLSNRPTWTAETNQRSRTLNYLKDWENTYLSKKRKKLRTARKKRIYEGIKLQKTWKGGRIEGSLER